jgi:3-hydroxyisobutyrate dehydrogenase
MQRVGFIGLGIMGESMCKRIIEGGYEVRAYDIEESKRKAMVDLGAKEASSLEEVASESNVIVIMVPKSEHVEQVMEGLMDHLRPDTIIIDMSTISPEVSRKLAGQVAKKNCVMLDAPVVKSKAAAESGDLGILVGGPEDAFGKVKPILERMGGEIIHMGANGNGLVMKLCHNMLVAQIQNGVNEMLVLAQKSGLEFDDVVRGVKAGGGQNFYLDAKSESIKKRDFDPKFPFEHMHKDLHLTLDLASFMGVDLPGAELATERYDRGMKEDYNRKDFSAAYEIVEKTSGSK